MSEFYVVKSVCGRTGKTRELQYATRAEAMEGWDTVCDAGFDGDKLFLIHPKGHSISEYAPVGNYKKGYL